MIPAKWEKLKEIFAAAEDLTEDERENYVRKASGGDDGLFDEVMSLLSSADQTENLIEGNSFDLAGKFFDNDVPKVGRRFGSYRIIKELGTGGMGSVFLVDRDDGEFKQSAALKIIRHTVPDAQTELRFRRERDILASLHHPNIARLYDGGVSESGEPFFVMEYLDGDQLNEYAAKNDLGLTDRLVIFLKVCSAVDYAHRNLTIHRDIKPGNIIVSAGGEPKLLDFGLAKLIDEQGSDNEQTATVFRAFTPAYASPEQILGKRITTSSDIYSLGVVLYEFLTGKKPFVFDGMSLEEIVRTITGSDPIKPSAARHVSETPWGNTVNIPADLDTIVLKSLEKEPERRYPSVAELAADVQRFLDGMPILARPSTFRYRATKFINRNKFAVAASVLIFISLLSGLGFSLWQAEVARNERDRAERRFQDVRKLSNSLLFEITPKIEKLEGSTEAREILVNRALEYLDSLAIEAVDDLELQKELAAAYEKIGELQGHPSKPNLGDFAGALASYEKANSIRLTQPQTPENLRLLAENFRHLSDARFSQGNTSGTLAALESSRNIYENLIESSPDDASIRLAYLRILTELSQYHQANNQYDNAVRFAELAIAGTAGLDPAARETREVYFVTHADLGNSLSWNSEQAKAEAAMAKAVEGVEQLLAEQANDARTRHLMWRVYMLASGIYEDIVNERSMAFAQKARQTAAKGVELDPADIQFRHNLARSNYRIGVAAVNLNLTGEAVSALDLAEKQFQALIEREPRNRSYRSDLGRIYTRIGLLKRQQNDLAGSTDAFRASLGLWQEIAARDPANKNANRDIALSIKYIGENLAKLGRRDEAAREFQRSLSMLRELQSANALGEFDKKLLSEIEGLLAAG